MKLFETFLFGVCCFVLGGVGMAALVKASPKVEEKQYKTIVQMNCEYVCANKRLQKIGR